MLGSWFAKGFITVSGTKIEPSTGRKFPRINDLDNTNSLLSYCPKIVKKTESSLTSEGMIFLRLKLELSIFREKISSLGIHSVLSLNGDVSFGPNIYKVNKQEPLL